MVVARPRVVVVGGGVGGLTSAIALATRGCRVTVLERAATLGGKMRSVDVGGAALDAGPTVLTMRWVFDELFAAAGESFDEHVTIRASSVLARHAWSDGTRLDLYADRDRSRDAIARVFGAAAGDAFVAFSDDTRRIYDAVLEPFLRSQRPTIGSIVRTTGLRGIGALGRIDAFRSMWAALSSRFAEPKLRQLFGRYATYCGSSPFEAPATLNLVAHVESEGVYRLEGGMSALGQALEGLATARGVDVRRGHEVEAIAVEAGSVRAVVANGISFPADVVVFNGDVSALERFMGGARAPKPTRAEDRSLSAVTWAIVGKTSNFPLLHHNVFFSDDYRAELDALVEQRRMPEAPTVYVCAQDRGDVTVDLDEERMLLVVNAPATGDEPARWSHAERARCEETSFGTMRRCGLRLEPRAMVQTTPVELARMFPATGGALYGPIARGPFSALSRSGARTKTRGLYLAGGSVHPGPGVPMAALSGRLAAEQALADFASMVPSPTPVMHGTTSMA